MFDLRSFLLVHRLSTKRLSEKSARCAAQKRRHDEQVERSAEGSPRSAGIQCRHDGALGGRPPASDGPRLRTVQLRHKDRFRIRLHTAG